VLSAFVFNAGLMLAAPVFPLYWVRALHASDSWIGIINTVNNGVLLVAYFLWTALLGRKGVVFVLRVCGFGLALYPLLTGLTKSVPPLALYAGMAGVFGAGINLVLFDILLSTCPQQRTASYVALYQTTTYAATFLGPLLGTTLAASLGYAPALFVSSGLRLAGVVLFILLDVGATATPERKPAELPASVRREVKG
jgi:MFS family permease